MKKGIAVFLICIWAFVCFGCGKETHEPTAGEEGLVTMTAVLTEDEETTLECTIFNKTLKDITTGDMYCLQVLKGKSFIDVPLLPESGGFNLISRIILSGDEYSYRAYIEGNYGDLEAGHYRIVKEYTIKESDNPEKENADKERVSAEFDLP